MATDLSATRGDVFPNLEEVKRKRRQRRDNDVPFGGSTMIPELLEARRLFASVSFSSGTWTLNADNTAETIYVYRVVETSPASDRIKFQIGLTIWSRDSADITNRVKVNANGGNDTVHVETDQEVANNLTVLGLNAKGNDGVHKVVEVQAGDGEDIVYGGDMGDTLQGGSLGDYMEGRGANDVMYGGYGGRDTLHGGDANDLMYGGDALQGGFEEDERDDLYGEGGNDTLRGEGGGDLLDPGPGDDFAFGGYGNDTFQGSLNDGGTDWLDGGDGTDDPGDYDSGDTRVSFP